MTTTAPKVASLERRARALVVALTAPLVIVILGLAWMQYRDQRREVLNEMAAACMTYTLALDTLAKSASDHVYEMRDWSARRFGLGHAGQRIDLPLARYGGGHTLAASTPAERVRFGQLFWTRATFDTPPDLMALGHASDFYALLVARHRRHPYFQWSYFFPSSEDYLIIYPWAPAPQLVEDLGHQNLPRMLESWFRYEIYVRSKPELNPRAEPYWTAPYEDAGGAGAMVSLGAPVHADGRFMGMVGTDITLQTLDDLVGRIAPAAGRLWVLDAQRHVLAASVQRPKGTIAKVEDVDGGLSDAAAEHAASMSGRAVRWHDRILISKRVDHAPWTLLYEVTEAELFQILAGRFLPYFLILASLLTAVGLAVFFLQRDFIRPALAVAGYVRRRVEQPRVAAPTVPALWQPVASAVSAAFGASESAMADLRRSEAFKSAIIDNALYGVATLDEQGRVIEFNAAAERMFRVLGADAAGRSFSDFITTDDRRTVFKERLEHLLTGTQTVTRWPGLQSQAQAVNGPSFPVEIVLSVAPVEHQRFVTAFIADTSQVQLAQLELEHQRERLRKAERQSALAGLVAGLAHELNNPLAILMARTELLRERAVDPSLQGDLDRIHAAAERSGRIVNKFQSLVREAAASRQAMVVQEVVRAAVDMVLHSLQEAGIELQVSALEGLPRVAVDPVLLGQVLMSLLTQSRNCLLHQVGRRSIAVSAQVEDGEMVLSVYDNRALAPSSLDCQQAPSFSADLRSQEEQGNLAFCRARMREQGGDLDWLAPADGGALFLLRLPTLATD